MTHKILSFDDLGITLSDLLREIATASSGGSSSSGGSAEGDGAFVAEASRVLEEVRGLLRPQFVWFVQRELPQFQLGKIIERQLRGSHAYAFFVCTAGGEFQEYQDRLMAEGDMVRVFIADTLGSLIAERTADVMEQSLQSSIDKLHWHRTNRFSPGYCGWHVSQQQILFRLFHEQTAQKKSSPFGSEDSEVTERTLSAESTNSTERAERTNSTAGMESSLSVCGVQLTPSSLMIPIKSVSGIIGLGESVRYLAYTCGICQKKDCYKRPTPQPPPVRREGES